MPKLMPDRISAADVKALLRRPVAFHPALARLAGSVPGGIWLSQLRYWDDRVEDNQAGERWFWKSLESWSEETALSAKELRRARRDLEALGVLHSRYDRHEHRLWWRLDNDRLAELLSEGRHLPKGQMPENPAYAQRAGATCPKGMSLTESSETTAETTDNGTGAAVTSPVLPGPSRARDCAVAAPVAPALALPVAPEPPEDPPPPRGGLPASPRPRVSASAPAPLPAPLASAAAEARVPIGIVAGALLEGRSEGLVLAWLVSLARRRSRFRAPAAVFRWAMLRGLMPPGCDHDQAKLQARGDLGCARARAFGHQVARALAASGRPAAEVRMSRRQLELLASAREQLADRPGALERFERELAERFRAVPPAACHPLSALTRRIA